MRKWELRLLVLVSILTLTLVSTLGSEDGKGRNAGDRGPRPEGRDMIFISSPGGFNVQNELVVPFSLDAGKQAPTAIQIEFTFHNGSMRLDRIVAGQRLEEAGKQVSFTTFPDGRTTRAVVVASGLNRSIIQTGPLLSLVFERLVDENPRVRVTSIQAVDADARELPAVELDTRSAAALLAAWTTRTGPGSSNLLIQTSSEETVDLYTRRIVVQGDSKRTIDTLIEASHLGSELRQFRVSRGVLPERLLLLAVRSGGDPRNETEIVGIQEISSNTGSTTTPASGSGIPDRTTYQRIQ